MPQLRSLSGKGGLPCLEDRTKLIKYLIVVCILLLAFNLAARGIVSVIKNKHKAGHLKFVAITHRHGARAGLWKFTFEEPELKWDVRLGALTPKGMEQAFFVGQKLRQLYWGYLPEFGSASSSRISVYSTYIDRTVDTAHSLLLGIFLPEEVKPNLGEGNCTCRPEMGLKSPVHCAAQCMGLNIIPENVPPVQPSERPLLLQFEECQGWGDQVESFKNSSDYKNAPNTVFKEQLEMVEHVIGGKEACVVSDVRGMDLRAVIDPPECSPIDLKVMERVWNNAVCAKTDGKGYPSDDLYGANFIAKMQEAVSWLWHQEYSVDRGPLGAGILLDEIMARMEAHLPGSGAQNKDFMVLYSAHDSTLAALLAVLGIVNWEYPDFVSRISLELRAHHSDDLDSFYVNLYYDDKPLEIPQCGVDCAWKDFEAIFKMRRKSMDSCVKV